ncbi:OmpH family outer membrane protein [bacterium]|nr:OmpH family outer membrane protein [bacterium]
MTKFRIFAVLFVLLMITPVYAQKIAFVDVKKVWSESKEVEKERKKVEALLKKSQDELKAKEAEVIKIQEKIKKEAKMATEEAQAIMLEEYQKKALELQKMAAQKEKELADKDAAAQEEFLGKVRKIAMKIALTKGYDMVVPAEQTLYYNDKFDITKDVIAEINK